MTDPISQARQALAYAARHLNPIADEVRDAILQPFLAAWQGKTEAITQLRLCDGCTGAVACLVEALEVREELLGSAASSVLAPFLNSLGFTEPNEEEGWLKEFEKYPVK